MKSATEKTLKWCKNKNSLRLQVYIGRQDVGMGLMWEVREQGHLGLKTQRMILQSSLPVLVQPRDGDRSVRGKAGWFRGRWVSGVVVFAPDWAKQSCSLCTNEPGKGTPVPNYSSFCPCTKQCLGFGVIFSLLYLPKNPDLETDFHFKWELWDLQNYRTLSALTQQSFLFGLCARIKGFTKLHTEYFNKIHSKVMNFAILQIR